MDFINSFQNTKLKLTKEKSPSNSGDGDRAGIQRSYIGHHLYTHLVTSLINQMKFIFFFLISKINIHVYFN